MRFLDTLEQSRWWRAWVVVLALLITYTAWDQRGPLVGLIAAAIYGLVFVFGALRRPESAAWAQRHPALDRAVIVPLAFVAFAIVTNWSLLLCLACGLALWALTAALAVRRPQPG